MKLNVSKHGRYQSALWRPFLTRTYYPILHHPRLEEPPDDSEKARIGDSMLQEPHQMDVANMIEESFDVRLHHPLRTLPGHDLRYSPQRIMSTPVGPKSIRTLTELRLPDRLQDLAKPILYQSVLKAGNPQRSVSTLPPLVGIPASPV